MKKYQIFISSTFTDLIDERQAAVEAILQAGHIPAGMELFAASNKSQWEIIKKWIDESDIYMLILGGRYGSIEPDSELSYTELEYNYACDIGKPLFTLVLNEDFIEQKVQKQGSKNIRELNEPQKLKAFSKNVLSKLCKICFDSKDIQLGVYQSISALEKEYSPAGWIPANQQFNPETYLKQISELSTEIENLRKINIELAEKDNQMHPSDLANLSNGDDIWTFTISFTADDLVKYSQIYTCNTEISISWNNIFSIISPIMSIESSQYFIHKALEDNIERFISNVIIQFCDSHQVKNPQKFIISTYDFDSIIIQLQLLNLISESKKKHPVADKSHYWTLTDYGKKVMLQLRSIKK